MAGNILPAYVLPGIPALGLLVAILVVKKIRSGSRVWLGSASVVDDCDGLLEPRQGKRKK